ncbi:probable G-protein coupled receptor No18 [Amphiura filiformis]|uniref:probable G-protein coupled receptor No18 n=1 Tax=Amphiura filiformis TaxID=82378 RepID=UPI003B216562
MDAAMFSIGNSSSASDNETVVIASNEDLYSYAERVVAAVICSIICIFGSIGNSLVIIAVLLSRKLHTPPNVFVVSLATADLLTSLFLIWDVVALLSSDGWPLPNAKWLCTMTSFVIFVCIGTSLSNLAAISLNRYILITKPYRTYQRIYSPVNIGLMVIFTWICPNLLSLLLSLTKIVGFGYNRKYFICCHFGQQPEDELLFILSDVLLIFIVLVVVVLSYIFVLKHVRQHFKGKRRREVQGIVMQASTSGNDTERQDRQRSTTAENSISQPDPSGQPIRRRENYKDLQVTKNLLLVVVVFFVCFLPYSFLIIFPRSDSFHLYAILLALMNSCVNPVIYARRHPHFKIVLSAMIKCQYQNIPEPTGIAKRFFSRGINPIL